MEEREELRTTILSFVPLQTPLRMVGLCKLFHIFNIPLDSLKKKKIFSLDMLSLPKVKVDRFSLIGEKVLFL